MTLAELKAHAVLDQEGKAILRSAYERFHMSVRSYYRVLRTSRTIADLDGSERINPAYVLEALRYRPQTGV